MARTNLDGEKHREMTLALGFGADRDDAVDTARASLERGFAGAARAHERGLARLRRRAQAAAYHLVWPRDLYQVASAQIALGDSAAAERSLDFAFERMQKPDGSFPQNTRVDGAENWTNL